MKYFIPIDKETIKRNPNAGKTEYIIPGALEVTLRAHNVSRQIFGDDRITPLEYYVYNRRIETLSATINDPSFIDDIEKYTKQYEVNYNRPVERFEVMRPEPEYLYSYQPVEVTCFSCGAVFSSNDLQSDEIYDGGTEYYSTEVCPKCGAFDCCEVEYEELTI